MDAGEVKSDLNVINPFLRLESNSEVDTIKFS